MTELTKMTKSESFLDCPDFLGFYGVFDNDNILESTKMTESESESVSESELLNCFSFLGFYGVIDNILEPIKETPTLVQLATKAMLRGYFQSLNYNESQVNDLTNIAAYILFNDDSENSNFASILNVVQFNELYLDNTILFNEIKCHINSLFKYIGLEVNESQNAMIKSKKNIAYFFCFYCLSFDLSKEVSSLVSPLNLDTDDLFDSSEPNKIFIKEYFIKVSGFEQNVSEDLADLVTMSLIRRKHCYVIRLISGRVYNCLRNCAVISPMIFAINKILKIYNIFYKSLSLSDNLVAFKFKSPKQYRAKIDEYDYVDGSSIKVTQKKISSDIPRYPNELDIRIGIKFENDYSGCFKNFANGTFPYNNGTKFDVRVVPIGNRNKYRLPYSIAKPHSSCSAKKIVKLTVYELEGFEITNKMIIRGVKHLPLDRRDAVLEDICSQIGCEPSTFAEIRGVKHLPLDEKINALEKIYEQLLRCWYERSIRFE